MLKQICLSLALTTALSGPVIAQTPASAPAQTAEQLLPRFEVDPSWPKQLPNNWLVGNVVGQAVDANDNIWVVHRPKTIPEYGLGATFNPPRAECCSPAPSVLVFNQAGDLIRSWGGPGDGYEWPDSEHSIYIDFKGNVWLSGNGPKDDIILKFTPEGKFLLQIGRKGQSRGDTDTANLAGPTGMFVDPQTNEVFVADGYRNHRVIVFDADTGEFKRMWGAYGNSLTDDKRTWGSYENAQVQNKLPPYNPDEPPSQQFRGPVHCIVTSKEGHLYVCDRTSDRIQVFSKDGKFIREGFVKPRTLGVGSTCDVAFSKDPDQRFMYVTDCSQMKMQILDRASMEIVSSVGAPGRGAGQFFLPHSMATDTKGNVYTGETLGMDRVQRFIFKGLQAPSR
jgi:DNA-binding beta-propeller fold protein YncE